MSVLQKINLEDLQLDFQDNLETMLEELGFPEVSKAKLESVRLSEPFQKLNSTVLSEMIMHVQYINYLLTKYIQHN